MFLGKKTLVNVVSDNGTGRLLRGKIVQLPNNFEIRKKITACTKLLFASAALVGSDLIISVL